MDDFEKALAGVIDSFNSSNFDRDGFIAKIHDFQFADKSSKDALTRILNNVKTDFSDLNATNNSDILLRRDIHNICQQMPEMRDVVQIVRDAIIESDAVTGGVSRNISFQTNKSTDSEANKTLVTDMESKFNLQLALKNFIIPQGLMVGEVYVNIIPYKRLFAELEALQQRKHGRYSLKPMKESHSIYSDTNLKILKESVTSNTKYEADLIHRIEHNITNGNGRSDKLTDTNIRTLLENIDVYDGLSVLIQEYGSVGLQKLLLEDTSFNIDDINSPRTFFEDVIMGKLKEEDIDYKKFNNVKGCYIKYLDPLKVIPIRMDRKVIGYYYVTTSMDLQVTPNQPNGIIDLSFQHYLKDKNLVANVANIIIKEFDKKFLDKNIALKSEIAEIIMEHKFHEGKLSFIYIPEDEIVRFVFNEDENGKGHSIIEPSLFPARLYLMLLLYNMLYTLNNTTTRVHYIQSSGLDKNYSSVIQRVIRGYQARRITVDDVYSYSGTLNKVGGIGEMIMPAGRGDTKALTTDTIPAVDNPINIEFLEMLRRQAISGTSVPALMVLNLIDEAEFAKTLELANTRFLSAVASYKIDCNKYTTKMYRTILSHISDLSDSDINCFQFAFNSIVQPMLSITNDMIQNFNNMYELIASIYYRQDQLADKEGKPSKTAIDLKRKLAQKFIPQLDYDALDKIVEDVNIGVNDELVQRSATTDDVNSEDLTKINSGTS